MKVSFVLNGRPVEVDADGLTPLLSLVREHAGTGAKLGCGEGRCGACTVLVEDQPVASCLYPAVNLDGKRVRTVESLAALSTAVQEQLGLKLEASTGPLEVLVIDHVEKPTPD